MKGLRSGVRKKDRNGPELTFSIYLLLLTACLLWNNVQATVLSRKEKGEQGKTH